ncbi:MmpS family transport accessory protein [Mycobacterium marinum]|uniref:MmpS family transport accessory protein n=1 Tax=Mycobacterium marinum TaxID=1781 RepID=UPI001FB5CD1E|nr:MmpS family transport accessory protein [Mycobacterium marinum]
MTYEVFDSGTYADIDHLDPEVIPRDLNKMELPWPITVRLTAASVAPILVAQGDGSTIRGRISVDGEVKG